MSNVLFKQMTTRAAAKALVKLADQGLILTFRDGQHVRPRHLAKASLTWHDSVGIRTLTGAVIDLAWTKDQEHVIFDRGEFLDVYVL